MRRVCLAVLGSVLALTPAWGQDAPAAPAPGSFELVEINPREVLVLDQRSGVLFAVNMRMRTAMMIDPIRGQAIARPLVESQRAASPAPPTWPSRPSLAARGTIARYRATPGDTPGVFDTVTGKLYLLDGPDDLRILDAVEGTLIRRGVAMDDRGVQLTEAEEAAAASLRAIAVAQRVFRTEDRERDGVADYASLQELAESQLIPSEPRDGDPADYRLRVFPSNTAPEQRWWGAASPLASGRYLVVNHLGVVHILDEPFEPDPGDCQLPPDAIPLD
jgi:hypothetical protein